MDWKDIACIVFIATTANHLGLVSAIESAIKHKIWIVDCPKCLTFWSVLLYGIATVPSGSPLGLTTALHLIAISFLSSYLAIWLELAEGFIDLLYIKVYEKIYPPRDDDAPPADAGDGHP